MRKFVAVGLSIVLLGLFGCGEAAFEQATTAEQTTIAEVTTEEPTTEEPEEEPVERPKPMWYSYTEFDEILQPGYISVNELTECFGEPIKLTGDVFDGLWVTIGVLYVKFNGIIFELWDNGDDVILSYNSEEAASYGYELSLAAPTEADKALRLELYSFTVTGENIPLPRGIRIGDDMDKVRELYLDASYIERDGALPYLSVNYYNKTEEPYIKQNPDYYPEWPYGIHYSFTDKKLTEASVFWFNNWARFD